MVEKYAAVDDVVEASMAVSDDIVFSDMISEYTSELLSEALYRADGSPLSNDNQINPEHVSQLNSIVVTAAIKSLSNIDEYDLNQN